MKLSLLKIFSYLTYIIVLSGLAFGQETSPAPSPVSADSTEAEATAREFRIYRDAMLQGSSDDIRADAAVSLLLQNDEQCRAALLSSLKSNENPQARRAVCQALIKSRGLSQTIDSIDVFLAPLLDILRGESIEQAELAAEALLLFDYSDVSNSFDQILQNAEISNQSRLNVVYALQLRTEPSALRVLIELLDDPNTEVAKAAETALQEAFGIPVGANRAVWSGILDELQLKSPEDIRRERLLRQEMKLRQVQAERDRWQKLYLSALDTQYESLDEGNREVMILDMIGSDLIPIRIWALDKASKHPILGEELRKKLLSLLSDSSRDVRLQAAKALINMSALDPAAVLLERLKLEEDSEVRLAMLEALGEACFFAFSPGSDIKLSEETKLETLEIAAGYLQSESADDCIKGAEVIRKILELNSLSESSMQSYLGLLESRYKKSFSENKELRSGLLGILAHLCGQGGAKDSACALFEPLFTEAMVVKKDPTLRLAAVQGLSYVDKIRALELFKQNNLMQDPSLAVQQVVIDVAGQAGDTTDLKWLLVLLNENGHGDRVWLAIKNICQRQQVSFLLDWLPELESTDAAKSEYVREILDIAEQKANGEKGQELLRLVREQIISRLMKGKLWEQAATYLTSINYSLSEDLYSDQTDFHAFTIYLYSGAVEKAVGYIKKRIEKSDMEQGSPLEATVNNYFLDKTIQDTSKTMFYKKISSIPKEGKPNWAAFIDNMGKQLGDSANPPVSQEPINPDEKGAEK